MLTVLGSQQIAKFLWRRQSKCLTKRKMRMHHRRQVFQRQMLSQPANTNPPDPNCMSYTDLCWWQPKSHSLRCTWAPCRQQTRFPRKECLCPWYLLFRKRWAPRLSNNHIHLLTRNPSILMYIILLDRESTLHGEANVAWLWPCPNSAHTHWSNFLFDFTRRSVVSLFHSNSHNARQVCGVAFPRIYELTTSTLQKRWTSVQRGWHTNNYT